jgi:hydroxyacylglutathione hydrolase
MELFFETIETKLLVLPDHVEVFPAHVAGSLCAPAIKSRLANLSAVPLCWRRGRPQNLAGARPLFVRGEPPALIPDEFDQRRRPRVLDVARIGLGSVLLLVYRLAHQVA